MLELNKIHQGDCLELIRQIDSESIDLIITSPPYNIGKMHSNRIQFGSYAGNDMEEKHYQTWQIQVLNECFRVLKKSGSIFYNHKVRIKEGLAIHPLKWILKSKFLLKQEIVWNQRKSANSDKIRFFPYTERIYWLVKDKETRANNKLSLSDCWDVVPTHKRKNNKHIAVMPEKIVENILNCFEGNLVLDPFAGYATTCLVAKNFNRNFIGIELNPTYVEIAHRRLGQEQLSIPPSAKAEDILEAKS